MKALIFLATIFTYISINTTESFSAESIKPEISKELTSDKSQKTDAISSSDASVTSDVPGKAAKSSVETDSLNVNTENKNSSLHFGQKAMVWRATMKVLSPDEARTQIEQSAKSFGGFLVHFAKGSIKVKLPPEQLSSFADQIADFGILLEKNLSSEDLTLRIAELKGRIKSREDILERTRKFLDDADVASTIDIERTMTDLVLEIERFKGNLRVLTDRSSFAVAEISFDFRERDRIVYIRSTFEWLNSIDLGSFVEGF